MRPALPISLLISAAVIGGAVFLFSARSSRPAKSSPDRTRINVRTTSTTRESVTLAEPVGDDREFKAVLTLRDIKRMVRQRLQQWQDTSTEDDGARLQLLESMAALLTKENAAELTRMLSPEELSSPFGLLALDRWLEASPADAARWMARQPNGTDEQARLVARRFLEDDAALRAYCDELTDTRWRQTFLGETSLLAVTKNPIQAASLAQRMKPGPEQTNVFETVVYDWATRDLQGAIGLVGTVADPTLRERALAMTAKAIAVGDPDLGAQWLSNAVKSEGVLKEAAQSIVEMWAEKSPAEAGQWLLRTADVKVRADAVNTLVHAWQKRDPAAAQAWIKTLPEGESVQAMLNAEQEEQARGQD
jgi:hypothetical protein